MPALFGNRVIRIFCKNDRHLHGGHSRCVLCGGAANVNSWGVTRDYRIRDAIGLPTDRDFYGLRRFKDEAHRLAYEQRRRRKVKLVASLLNKRVRMPWLFDWQEGMPKEGV
jgi:hypothetical protein